MLVSLDGELTGKALGEKNKEALHLGYVGWGTSIIYIYKVDAQYHLRMPVTHRRA